MISRIFALASLVIANILERIARIGRAIDYKRQKRRDVMHAVYRND